MGAAVTTPDEQPTFPGTPVEGSALVAAVQRNCTCVPEDNAAPGDPCPAHQMLKQPKTLDHLVYARRRRSKWEAAEFTDTKKEQTDANDH